VNPRDDAIRSQDGDDADDEQCQRRWKSTEPAFPPIQPSLKSDEVNPQQDEDGPDEPVRLREKGATEQVGRSQSEQECGTAESMPV
jgi:hypothetical protein